MKKHNKYKQSDSDRKRIRVNSKNNFCVSQMPKWSSEELISSCQILINEPIASLRTLSPACNCSKSLTDIDKFSLNDVNKMCESFVKKSLIEAFKLLFPTLNQLVDSTTEDGNSLFVESISTDNSSFGSCECVSINGNKKDSDVESYHSCSSLLNKSYYDISSNSKNNILFESLQLNCEKNKASTVGDNFGKFSEMVDESLKIGILSGEQYDERLIGLTPINNDLIYENITEPRNLGKQAITESYSLKKYSLLDRVFAPDSILSETAFIEKQVDICDLDKMSCEYQSDKNNDEDKIYGKSENSWKNCEKINIGGINKRKRTGKKRKKRRKNVKSKTNLDELSVKDKSYFCENLLVKEELYSHQNLLEHINYLKYNPITNICCQIKITYYNGIDFYFEENVKNISNFSFDLKNFLCTNNKWLCDWTCVDTLIYVYNDKKFSNYILNDNSNVISDYCNLNIFDYFNDKFKNYHRYIYDVNGLPYREVTRCRPINSDTLPINSPNSCSKECQKAKHFGKASDLFGDDRFHTDENVYSYGCYSELLVGHVYFLIGHKLCKVPLFASEENLSFILSQNCYCNLAISGHSWFLGTNKCNSLVIYSLLKMNVTEKNCDNYSSEVNGFKFVPDRYNKVKTLIPIFQSCHFLDKNGKTLSHNSKVKQITCDNDIKSSVVLRPEKCNSFNNGTSASFNRQDYRYSLYSFIPDTEKESNINDFISHKCIRLCGVALKPDMIVSLERQNLFQTARSSFDYSVNSDPNIESFACFETTTISRGDYFVSSVTNFTVPSDDYINSSKKLSDINNMGVRTSKNHDDYDSAFDKNDANILDVNIVSSFKPIHNSDYIKDIPNCNEALIQNCTSSLTPITRCLTSTIPSICSKAAAFASPVANLNRDNVAIASTCSSLISIVKTVPSSTSFCTVSTSTSAVKMSILPLVSLEKMGQSNVTNVKDDSKTILNKENWTENNSFTALNQGSFIQSKVLEFEKLLTELKLKQNPLSRSTTDSNLLNKKKKSRRNSWNLRAFQAPKNDFTQSSQTKFPIDIICHGRVKEKNIISANGLQTHDYTNQSIQTRENNNEAITIANRITLTERLLPNQSLPEDQKQELKILNETLTEGLSVNKTKFDINEKINFPISDISQHSSSLLMPNSMHSVTVDSGNILNNEIKSLCTTSIDMKDVLTYRAKAAILDPLYKHPMICSSSNEKIQNYENIIPSEDLSLISFTTLPLSTDIMVSTSTNLSIIEHSLPVQCDYMDFQENINIPIYVTSEIKLEKPIDSNNSKYITQFSKIDSSAGLIKACTQNRNDTTKINFLENETICDNTFNKYSCINQQDNEKCIKILDVGRDLFTDDDCCTIKNNEHFLKENENISTKLKQSLNKDLEIGSNITKSKSLEDIVDIHENTNKLEHENTNKLEGLLALNNVTSKDNEIGSGIQNDSKHTDFTYKIEDFGINDESLNLIEKKEKYNLELQSCATEKDAKDIHSDNTLIQNVPSEIQFPTSPISFIVEKVIDYSDNSDNKMTTESCIVFHQVVPKNESCVTTLHLDNNFNRKEPNDDITPIPSPLPHTDSVTLSNYNLISEISFHLDGQSTNSIESKESIHASLPFVESLSTNTLTQISTESLNHENSLELHNKMPLDCYETCDIADYTNFQKDILARSDIELSNNSNFDAGFVYSSSNSDIRSDALDLDYTTEQETPLISPVTSSPYSLHLSSPLEGPVARRDLLPLDEDYEITASWQAFMSVNRPDSDDDHNLYDSDDDFDNMDVEMRRLEEKLKKFEMELGMTSDVESEEKVKTQSRLFKPRLRQEDIDVLKTFSLPDIYPPVDKMKTKHLSLMKKHEKSLYEDSATESLRSSFKDSALYSGSLLLIKSGRKDRNKCCRSLDFHVLKSNIKESIFSTSLMNLADKSDDNDILEENKLNLSDSTYSDIIEEDLSNSIHYHIENFENLTRISQENINLPIFQYFGTEIKHSNDSESFDLSDIIESSTCFSQHSESLCEGYIWHEADSEMNILDFDDLDLDSFSCENSILFIFEDDDNDDDKSLDYVSCVGVNYDSEFSLYASTESKIKPKTPILEKKESDISKKKPETLVSTFKNSFRKAAKYLTSKGLREEEESDFEGQENLLTLKKPTEGMGLYHVPTANIQNTAAGDLNYIEENSSIFCDISIDMPESDQIPLSDLVSFPKGVSYTVDTNEAQISDDDSFKIKAEIDLNESWQSSFLACDIDEQQKKAHVPTTIKKLKRKQQGRIENQKVEEKLEASGCACVSLTRGNRLQRSLHNRQSSPHPKASSRRTQSFKK